MKIGVILLLCGLLILIITNSRFIFQTRIKYESITVNAIDITENGDIYSYYRTINIPIYRITSEEAKNLPKNIGGDLPEIESKNESKLRLIKDIIDLIIYTLCSLIGLISSGIGVFILIIKVKKDFLKLKKLEKSK